MSVFLSSGLIDLNKIIKQATVRKNVVVQLIRMWRDAGHPDYQVNMQEVEARADQLAATNAPTIPNGITHFFEEEHVQNEGVDDADKAAAPSERIGTGEHLTRAFERTRPLMMMAQRDSDANRMWQRAESARSANSRKWICTSAPCWKINSRTSTCHECML